MLTVHQAYTSAFIAADFGLPIAHDGQDFKPGGAFIAIRTTAGETAQYSLADTNVTTGVFQFDIRYPAGRGAIDALAMRDTVFAEFPLGGTLSYGGQTVETTGFQSVSNRTDGGWYLAIGRILWRAYAPR